MAEYAGDVLTERPTAIQYTLSPYTSDFLPLVSSLNAKSNVQTTSQELDDPENNSSHGLSPQISTGQELRRLSEQLEQKLGYNSQRRSEFIWTVIYSTMGMFIMVVFGLFSVFAEFDSRRANDLSAIANRIALLSLCQSQPNVSIMHQYLVSRASWVNARPISEHATLIRTNKNGALRSKSNGADSWRLNLQTTTYSCSIVNSHQSAWINDMTAEILQDWTKSKWTSKEFAGLIVMSWSTGVAFLTMCWVLIKTFKKNRPKIN